MRVWDIQEFELLAEHPLVENSLGLITYNTKIIVSEGAVRGTIAVYDFVEKGVIKRLASVEIGRGIAWGRVIDDEWIVVGGEEGSVVGYSFAKGSVGWVIDAHQGAIEAVA